jgi:hypothetical protein
MKGYKVAILWLDYNNNKLCDSVVVYRENLDQLIDDINEHINEVDDVLGGEDADEGS